MVPAIDQVHPVIVVDEDAVRPGEHPLTPRVEELPVLVEHDERVLPAAEDVDPVAGIDRDARHLGERPAFGKAFPAFRHLELQTVVSLWHPYSPVKPIAGVPHGDLVARVKPGIGTQHGQNAVLPKGIHLMFHLLERRQFTQQTEIIDLLGHAMHVASHIPDETLQPTTSKAARLVQELMEDLLGVRQVFEILRVGYVQPLATLGITCGLPQGGFIDEQPRFLHPYRNDANDRQRANGALLQ